MAGRRVRRWSLRQVRARAVSALCIASTSVSFACGARELPAPYPAPAPASDERRFGARLQRTMRSLATSTPEHRETVKVLFYGQSITREPWTLDVADRLRARYPDADLIVENRAVGGFTADLLIRTAEHDVYGFMPDLIVIHDLFQKEEDFEALIEAFTSRTTAEIAIQTTHRRGEGLRATRWDDRCSDTYRRVADANRLELIDVRSAWKAYLDAHDLHPSALLVDEAGHLNGAGNALMGALVERHLRDDPSVPAEPKGITTLAIGEDVHFDASGRLVLPFDGVRVEGVIATPASTTSTVPVKVMVDGRAPSSFLGAWQITRGNGDAGRDWPWEVAAPIRITARSVPIEETWTATLTGFDPSFETFDFRVVGSKTGDDGEGTSDKDFTSRSGRVVIEARDWWLSRAHALKGRRFVDGTTITWRTEPLHRDVVHPIAPLDPSKEHRVVLVAGLPSGKHELVLEKQGAGEAPIAALRIYDPAARRSRR